MLVEGWTDGSLSWLAKQPMDAPEPQQPISGNSLVKVPCSCLYFWLSGRADTWDHIELPWPREEDYKIPLLVRLEVGTIAFPGRRLPVRLVACGREH